MPPPTSDVAFSPAVKAVQQRLGSRQRFIELEEAGGWPNTVTPDLAAFLAARDSFYLASASAAGQPYIQHRGGPPGFLKTRDERTLAFGDFSGNRQYVSLGNLSENDRVCLFAMDYANRRRVKIWGRAMVVEDDRALLDAVTVQEYAARPQRAIVVRVNAWDVNCTAHIARRFSEREAAEQIAALRSRIDALERELAALRGGATSPPADTS
ncbi:MAG: pyridoxamine 5'-phosphate oxidase family protein [Phycisphaerae bacterium]